MSASFVFFIEADGVVGIELSHKQWEITSTHIQQYMLMVIHQAVDTYVCFADTASFAEHLQELLFVFIAPVDIGAYHTSVDDIAKPSRSSLGLWAMFYSLCEEKYSLFWLR